MLFRSGISTYSTNSEAGSLKDGQKRNWRSITKGIPAKLRDKLVKHNEAEIQGVQSSTDLPEWFTRDLVWLCACIYAHVAQCNHHTEALEQLSKLQMSIRSRMDSASSGAGSSEHDARIETWPVRTPAARECLLKLYSKGIGAPDGASAESSSNASQS